MCVPGGDCCDALHANFSLLPVHAVLYKAIDRCHPSCCLALFLWLDGTDNFARTFIISIQLQVPPLLSVWGTLGEDRETFTCTIKRDAEGRFCNWKFSLMVNLNSCFCRSPKMFLFLLGFTLPCLAIIICYSAIFYRVRTSRQAVVSFQKTLHYFLLPT